MTFEGQDGREPAGGGLADGAPRRPGAGNVDALIEGLASRQHGVVTRQQLLGAGISRHLVDGRVKRGRLHRLHQGVYRVGPALSPYVDLMAAVLACGPEAVVSHGSAAGLWGLLPGADRGVPHLIDPTGDHRRPGLRIHQSASLQRNETTHLHGIPVTTAARTLLDLAGTVELRELERATAEAYARGLTRETRLRDLLMRHPFASGVASLRLALGSEAPAFTRSEAEERFLSIVRDAQLPSPKTNVRVAGYEVDFLWRAQRLVAEVDGRASHGTSAAFERDRRRDAHLVAQGLRVVRVTWRQLTEEPLAVVARLALALNRPAWPRD